MTTHFKPANTAIQEMKPWHLEEEPARFRLHNPNAKYAVIMVMAGDDDVLGGQVLPDIGEMAHGLMGGNEISVLFLADFEGGTKVAELLSKGRRVDMGVSGSICTGDPRPIAEFLTLALNSYSKETRIALGFWGHGNGVFLDLDPHENLIPDRLIELPLGTPITETMFLENYLAEPVPVKSMFNKGMLPDHSTGGVLTNRELSSALTVAFSRCRRKKPVDLIFFDTCNNGAVEVYAEMRKYCDVFIASCLSIPGIGWNYTWFLQMTRQSLPKDAKEWARLAIAAYNKTYDQTLYPRPVQLAAIDSQAKFIDRFKVVTQHLRGMNAEERTKLMSCSNDLFPVAHNETVDICSVAMALRDTSKDEKMVTACKEFLDAYLDGLVAISAPANNGIPYLGLSLWCPRLGDGFSVSKYYHNLRFNKETGWFDAVKEMVKEEQTKPTGPSFSILSFGGVELISAQEVETTDVDLDEGTLDLHISDTSKKWSGDLESGRYRYKNVTNAVIPSLDQMKLIIGLFGLIRRKDHEFAPFESALEEDVVLDGNASARLAYEFMKYERIVIDEFPKSLEPYLVLCEQAQKAAKTGILIIGKVTYGAP